jgi:hypothetical protein
MQMDFAYTIRNDGTLGITLAPPIPVGGQSFVFGVGVRLGGSMNLIQKSIASGFAGSGITITNSGNGQFNVTIAAQDTSGWSPGNYAYQFQRTQSGQFSTAVEGYMILGY